MNLFKSFLRNVYYFGVGLNATCQDVKDSLSGAGRRKMMISAMSLAVATAIVASGCSSRSASEEPSNVDANASAPSVSEGSSAASDVEKQPEVELLASATRYNEVNNEQLALLFKEKKEEYQEKAAESVPTGGNIEEWKQINPHTVGWITIPDTNIDYPLLYTTNTDYYTHRGYYQEYSKNGVIWFDADTRFDANGDPISSNSIIYGHNWTNCWNPIRIGDAQDIMFGQLAAYHYEDFGKSHPAIYITTPSGQHKYEIFTAFYTDLSFKYYYAELPATGAPLTMQQMIDQATAKSQYSFGVKASASDKIITLSTCTRIMGAGDNQRFVVMAKKVS